MGLSESRQPQLEIDPLQVPGDVEGPVDMTNCAKVPPCQEEQEKVRTLCCSGCKELLESVHALMVTIETTCHFKVILSRAAVSGMRENPMALKNLT